MKWYDQYYYDTIHPDNHHHSDITNNDCSTVDTCHCHYEDFYKWLADNGKITMENREKLSKIYSIFIIPDTLDIRQLSNNNCYPHKETIIQWDIVKNILTPLGFLFPTNII